MSKVGTKTETRDFPVYTNEQTILQNNVKPLFMLAGRFKCYKLTVRRNQTQDEKVFAYLVAGEKINERVMVYLTFEDAFSLITQVKIHRRSDFDPELGRYLGLALAFKLKADGIFTFAKNAFPVFPRQH